MRPAWSFNAAALLQSRREANSCVRCLLTLVPWNGVEGELQLLDGSEASGQEWCDGQHLFLIIFPWEVSWNCGDIELLAGRQGQTQAGNQQRSVGTQGNLEA